MAKVGRKGKYESVEALQKAIDDYFAHGIALRKVVIGSGNNKRVEEIPVPTITGLVLHCGFANRQSFYDMEKKPEFACTIKRARSFIEKEYEEQLQSGNCVGAIFALKNFGWTDRQEMDLTSGGKPLQVVMFGQESKA